MNRGSTDMAWQTRSLWLARVSGERRVNEGVMNQRTSTLGTFNEAFVAVLRGIVITDASFRIPNLEIPCSSIAIPIGVDSLLPFEEREHRLIDPLVESLGISPPLPSFDNCCEHHRFEVLT